MLLLLAAFVIWFLIEPRMIWPGFLLTFLLGAALMLLPLLAVNLPSVGPLDTVATLIVLAFAGVIALSPVLAGLFLCVNFFIMWRKEGLTTATKLQWETATVFMVASGCRSPRWPSASSASSSTPPSTRGSSAGSGAPSMPWSCSAGP